MNRQPHMLCAGIGLSAAIGLAGVPAAHASDAGARCAALGTYAILQAGARYAASAPPSGPIPLVYGGSATIQRYTGCGAATALQITATGPGTLLDRSLPAALGTRLRAAGDLLLRFTATATQDPAVPHDARAVRLSGTATYVHVTTSGTLRGMQRLKYSAKTVQVKNVPAQLRVTSDRGGAFSLSCALPGPSIGGLASEFAYVAVGARTPATFTATKTQDKNL